MYVTAPSQQRGARPTSSRRILLLQKADLSASFILGSSLSGRFLRFYSLRVTESVGAGWHASTCLFRAWPRSVGVSPPLRFEPDARGSFTLHCCYLYCCPLTCARIPSRDRGGCCSPHFCAWCDRRARCYVYFLCRFCSLPDFHTALDEWECWNAGFRLVRPSAILLSVGVPLHLQLS